MMALAHAQGESTADVSAFESLSENSDRRQEIRIDCQLSTSQRDLINNISKSGALLVARRKFVVGEAVAFSFPLPKEAKPLRLGGKIVRKAAASVSDSKVSSYGVAFEALREEAISALSNFVESRHVSTHPQPTFSLNLRPRVELGRRVVITGIGVVSPIGNGVDEFWQALLEGKSGVRQVEDTFSPGNRYYAAPVPNFDLNDFQDERFYMRLRKYYEAKKVAYLSKEIELLIASIQLALEDSNFVHDRISNDIGVVLGFESSGFTAKEDGIRWLINYIKDHPEEDKSNIALTFIQHYGKTWVNTYAFADLYYVNSAFGFHGHSTTLNNASSSGLATVLTAFDKIRLGQADMMVTAAAEDLVHSMRYHFFNALKVYSADGVIKPFDKDRYGWVLGEGGVSVILEEREHAIRRGAKIYAEVASGILAQDSSEFFLPDADVKYLRRTYEQALINANLKKDKIKLVLPHSTATQVNDLIQADVAHAVFKENQPYHYSFTSQIGHPMGASGLFRTAVGALSIKHATIPPTYGVDHMDPECDLRLAKTPIKERIESVLVSAIAFGGNNGAMALKEA